MAEPETIYYPTELEDNSNSKFGKTEDDTRRYVIFKCRDYKMISKESVQEVKMDTKSLFHIGLFLPNGLQERISQTWGASQILNAPTVVTNLLEAAGQKLGIAGNRIRKGMGVTTNPAEELLYKNPEFRSFSFNFTFTPRNLKEQATIKTILLAFKRYCLPKMGAGSAYITFPAVWEIVMEGIDGKEGSDNLMSFCFSATNVDGIYNEKFFALTDMTTDYTPNESFMSFHNGWPTKTSLSLTFLEMEPLYRSREGWENIVVSEGLTGIFEKMLSAYGLDAKQQAVLSEKTRRGIK